MSSKPLPRLSERPLYSRSQSTVSSIDSHKTPQHFNTPSLHHTCSHASNEKHVKKPSIDQKLVKWGIAWHPPTLMILYFVGGLALAIGHHFYYASLHGTLAGSSTRQQWATGFGTAVSFLIVALLRAASSAAYNQYVWVLVRRNSYRLSTIDKLFALTSDPSGFFGWKMLRCAKIAMAVAAIGWITPFAGIAPPASLSVVSGLLTEIRPTLMPSLNWNAAAFYDLQDFYSLPSAKVVSLATQSALSMEILPLTPPQPNSTFHLQFYGPSIKCSPPNSTQQIIIDHYTDALARNRQRFGTVGPIVTQQTLPAVLANDTTSSESRLMFYSMLAFSAFAPYAGSQGWLHGLTAIDNSSIDQFNNWDVDLPWEMNELGWDVNAYLFDDVVQKLYLQTSNSSYFCIMGNSSYDVDYEFRNGVQTSVNYTTSSFVPTEVMRAGGGGSGGRTQDVILEGPYNRFELSYMAVWEAFTSMVSGNITMGYFGVGSVGNDTPGTKYNLTLLDISSRTLLTGLSACDDIVHNIWETMPLTVKNPDVDPNVFFAEAKNSKERNGFMEKPSWMCRNSSIALAVEDLLGNITISMLSSAALTFPNSSLINVTHENTRNIYQYSSQNLIVSYTVAVILTLLGVAIGVFSFLDNGVAHSMAFSAILSTTRNAGLDELVLGQSIGAIPLDDDVGRAKLRFGELKGRMGRVGFGFEDEVGGLWRGGKYI